MYSGMLYQSASCCKLHKIHRMYLLKAVCGTVRIMQQFNSAGRFQKSFYLFFFQLFSFKSNFCWFDQSLDAQKSWMILPLSHLSHLKCRSSCCIVGYITNFLNVDGHAGILYTQNICMLYNLKIVQQYVISNMAKVLVYFDCFVLISCLIPIRSMISSIPSFKQLMTRSPSCG